MEDIKASTFWSSIRDFWKSGKTGAALTLISIFVLIYGYIAFDYEIVQGWKGHVSFQNTLKDISSFIPVGGALVAMIVGGIDIMMLLSDWYLERREKRIQAALAEGKAEGKIEGKIEGKAEVYHEIAEWYRRKDEVEARGEKFTEPPPAPSLK